MTSAESVAVVVPTFNGVTELPRLLEALAAQQGRFRPEVIAVDSGSTDGTLDLLVVHGEARQPLRSHVLSPGVRAVTWREFVADELG